MKYPMGEIVNPAYQTYYQSHKWRNIRSSIPSRAGIQRAVITGTGPSSAITFYVPTAGYTPTR